MKDTVSHYVPPQSPLTSTEPQVFSNNLTMPFALTEPPLKLVLLENPGKEAKIWNLGTS